MRWLERLLDKSVPLTNYRGEAASWGSCAVNEVHQDFPKAVFYSKAVLVGMPGAPLDNRLYILGSKFYDAVANNKRSEAIKLYDAIQVRVRTLLKRKFYGRAGDA